MSFNKAFKNECFSVLYLTSSNMSFFMCLQRKTKHIVQSYCIILKVIKLSAKLQEHGRHTEIVSYFIFVNFILMNIEVLL